jgi:hypothetical protein
MIATPSCAGEQQLVVDEQSEFVDLAAAWALLNVVEDQSEAVRGARENILCRLDEQGITQADLFEYVAEAVDRGDWAALGISKPED